MNRWINKASTLFIVSMIVSFVGFLGVMILLVAFDGTIDRDPPWLNTAFVVTWLIALAMTLPIAWYARSRPIDKAPTWGEAMIAATYVFFLLFWLYGVVPHQFLTWTDSELAWRSDKMLVGWTMPGTEEGIMQFILPFDLNYLIVRDILVVILYNIFFGAQIALWIIWQLRGKEVPSTGIDKSRYGRPVQRARTLATDGANA